MFIALSIKQGALRPAQLAVSLRFPSASLCKTSYMFTSSNHDMLFLIADIGFGIFLTHGPGGVHQLMNMENFVDILDNDSDAAAPASTLVAAASAAAEEAGVQA
jgi:hypothetical protein